MDHSKPKDDAPMDVTPPPDQASAPGKSKKRPPRKKGLPSKSNRTDADRFKKNQGTGKEIKEHVDGTLSDPRLSQLLRVDCSAVIRPRELPVRIDSLCYAWSRVIPFLRGVSLRSLTDFMRDELTQAHAFRGILFAARAKLYAAQNRCPFPCPATVYAQGDFTNEQFQTAISRIRELPHPFGALISELGVTSVDSQHLTPTIMRPKPSVSEAEGVVEALSLFMGGRPSMLARLWNGQRIDRRARAFITPFLPHWPLYVFDDDVSQVHSPNGGLFNRYWLSQEEDFLFSEAYVALNQFTAALRYSRPWVNACDLASHDGRRSLLVRMYGGEWSIHGTSTLVALCSLEQLEWKLGACHLFGASPARNELHINSNVMIPPNVTGHEAMVRVDDTMAALLNVEVYNTRD